MKLRKFGLAIHSSVLMLLSAAISLDNLHAQELMQLPLNVAITATVQAADDGGSPIRRMKTTVMRLTTKDLLGFIAEAEGTNYPFGARLVLTRSSTNASYQVVDTAGKLLLDASKAGYFTPEVVGTAVLNGQVNSQTGRESLTNTYSYSVSFDDHRGNSIGFNGVVRENYFQSAPDLKGSRKITDSNVFNGFGTGFIGGKPAVFTEKMTAIKTVGTPGTPDTTSSAVKISSPTPGQRISSPVISISGTAQGSIGTVIVECSFETASGFSEWLPMATVPGSVGGTVRWYNTLPTSELTKETNTIHVRVSDTSGKIVAEATVNFNYVPWI